MSAAAAIQGIAAGAQVGTSLYGLLQQKKFAREQKSFGQQQMTSFDQGMAGIRATAGRLSEYKADASPYESLTEAAKQRAMLAGGRVSGEDLAMERIGQSQTDALARARAFGGSASQRYGLLGLTSAQGAEQQRMAGETYANIREQRQMVADQNLFSALGAQAAETIRQRGLQFQSKFDKQKLLLDLDMQTLQGKMGLKQSTFDAVQQSKGAFVKSLMAFGSGLGDIGMTIGQGIGEQERFNKQMEFFNENPEKFTFKKD